MRHATYYYLFVSRDYCCKGTDSTYQIAVGRSDSITGPYVDKDGRDLAAGGGTTLLTSDGNMIGPGRQSYDDDYLAFHFYDGAADGKPTLAIRQVSRTDDGWPVVQTAEQPETPRWRRLVAAAALMLRRGAPLPRVEPLRRPI